MVGKKSDKKIGERYRGGKENGNWHGCRGNGNFRGDSHGRGYGNSHVFLSVWNGHEDSNVIRTADLKIGDTGIWS